MLFKCFVLMTLFFSLSFVCECENALQKKHHQTSTSVPNRSHNETVKEHSSDLAKYFNSTKPLLENSGEQAEQKPALYGRWSKWSRCRKCRKIRRKVCVSKKCQRSRLYEEKPCNLKRCKRKNRRGRKKFSVLQKVQTRALEESDHLYTKWSPWTVCSSQCMTFRERRCKFPGTCAQNPDFQMGYCYVEHSFCHHWIQNKLNRQSQHEKYAYESAVTLASKEGSVIADTCFVLIRTHQCDTTDQRPTETLVQGCTTDSVFKPYVSPPHKKPKKVRFSPRKCGVAYRSKKKKYSKMLKIMGGRVTKALKWPWHVALLNWKKEVFCGGTLISPKHILTAAHCLRKVLYARLNEFDISYQEGNEIEYRIHKMYPHGMYDDITINNDIAILRLPKSVPLPYACLPETDVLPIKHNCTIVGWGKRSPRDYIGSKYLREAQIPIVSKAACKRSYRYYNITDNMFCAGHRNGGIDTCSGDSGGGFMCLPRGKRAGWTVQGITSFGESCGKKGKFGIYTDVRKYLRWIEKKIEET